MKRLTVAAAALAAGMLTIVAQSKAESDRNMLGSAARTTAKTEKPAGKKEANAAAKTGVKTAAADADKREPRRSAGTRTPADTKIASLQAKHAGKGRVGVRLDKAAIDEQKTASVAPRIHPVLKAVARKAVKGLADIHPEAQVASTAIEGLAGVQSDTKLASAAAYTEIVARYASSYGVPATLAHAVISIESNYSPDKLGSAGEIGLMQIKPATAKLMGYSGSVSGLYDPEINIKYGMKYLGEANQLSGGDTCGTILRYNAGHGATTMNPISAAYCVKVKQLING
jgi:soluble lytic murein transglycosylase-like protein